MRGLRYEMEGGVCVCACVEVLAHLDALEQHAHVVSGDVVPDEHVGVEVVQLGDEEVEQCCVSKGQKARNGRRWHTRRAAPRPPLGSTRVGAPPQCVEQIQARSPAAHGRRRVPGQQAVWRHDDGTLDLLACRAPTGRPRA